MDIKSVIRDLEFEWDLENGFLGGIREGNFQPDRLERLIGILKAFEYSSITCLDKRFVSLTWYIPIFLIWQKDRFIEQGREVIEIDRALNRIQELLDEILGTP